MKEILCFGDSNTYGLIPGTKNRYGRDTRWTGLIEQQLYGKGYRIIEEGLCGRTTVFEDELREGRKGAAFLPTLLESHAPVNRVVLMLGTNDCKTFYNASAEVIGKGMRKTDPSDQKRGSGDKDPSSLTDLAWRGRLGGRLRSGVQSEFR